MTRRCAAGLSPPPNKDVTVFCGPIGRPRNGGHPPLTPSAHHHNVNAAAMKAAPPMTTHSMPQVRRWSDVLLSLNQGSKTRVFIMAPILVLFAMQRFLLHDAPRICVVVAAGRLHRAQHPERAGVAAIIPPLLRVFLDERVG